MSMAPIVHRLEFEVLPPGMKPLRLLHISDLHLRPNRNNLMRFIISWKELAPDFIVSTGDHIAHAEAISPLIEALSPLSDIPGFFVLGSNDYFAPTFKNPFKYLLPVKNGVAQGPKLPTKLLESQLQGLGWKQLHDVIVETTIKEVRVELRGTNDAHLGYDTYEMSKGRQSNSDLSIGVTHAPYRRILEAFTLDGVDLILAGHTHGGQVRIPWLGGTRALTTNCDLPKWRAQGLTSIRGQAPLHVSSGLGSSPFHPPRVLNPPSVTLITLTSRS